MLTQITDSIYIGDAQDASDQSQLAEYSIDCVVTLAEPRLETTTEYYPLIDGENEQADFDDAVDTVRSYIGSERRVLVHCRMGRSRSPTVTATALAAERDLLLADALGVIHETGRFISPDRQLLEHGRQYLDEPTYKERAEEERT